MGSIRISSPDSENVLDLVNKIFELEDKGMESKAKKEEKKVKTTLKEKQDTVRKLENQISINTPSRDDFFELNSYQIRRLVLNGLSLKDVSHAATMQFTYSEEFTYSDPSPSVRTKALENVRDKLFVAMLGEKDHAESLYGSKVRVLSHELTKGYVGVDILKRVTRVFTKLKRSLVNYINRSINKSYQQLKTASDAIKLFSKEYGMEVPSKDVAIEDAKFVVSDFMAAMQNKSSKRSDRALFLDPDLGRFVWKRGKFEDSLADRETTLSLFIAMVQLSRAGLFHVKDIKGKSFYLPSILEELGNSAWGKNYLEKKRVDFETTKNLIEKEQLLSITKTIDSKVEDQAEQYNEITRNIENPELSIPIKREIVIMLTEKLSETLATKDAYGQGTFGIFDVIAALDKVPALNDLNTGLKTIMSGNPLEEIYDLKKRTDRLRIDYPEIPKDKTKRKEFKKELSALMSLYEKTMKNLKKTPVETGLAEILYSIPGEFHKNYIRYLAFKKQDSSSALDEPYDDMWNTFLGASLQVKSTDKPYKPDEASGHPPKVLVETYKELKEKSKDLYIRLESEEKLVQRLLEISRDPIDKGVLTQVLSDVKLAKMRFDEFAESCNIIRPIPSPKDIEKIDQAHIHMQEAFLSILRIATFSNKLNDIDLRIAKESKEYEDFRRGILDSFRLAGETGVALFIVPQQRLSHISLFLKDVIKHELSPERIKAFQRIMDRHSVGIMQIIDQLTDPVTFALKRLKGKELEEHQEVFTIEKDLRVFYQELKKLKPEEKIRVEDSAISVKTRTGKRGPVKSIKAMDFFLDRVIRAAELGIFSVEIEGKRIFLEDMLNSEEMNNKKWATDVFNASSDLSAKRISAEQAVQIGRRSAKGGELQAIQKIREYKVPESIRSEIEKKFVNVNEKIPEEQRKKEVAEKFLVNLEMVLKMFAVKNRDLYKQEDLKGVYPPEDFLQTYKEKMSTKGLLTCITFALKDERIQINRKNVIFQFIDLFIKSPEHRNDVSEYKKEIGEILQIARKIQSQALQKSTSK